MDVWHSNGDRELARYSSGGRDIVLIEIFGAGTPGGQFDRYDLLDAGDSPIRRTGGSTL